MSDAQPQQATPGEPHPAPPPPKPKPEPFPLPPLRPQPKTMDEVIARLATGQHNGGRRAPRPAIVWGSVWLGVAMMVGAIVWFILALLVGYLFIYPPILFVLGFVALLKGLIGLRE